MSVSRDFKCSIMLTLFKWCSLVPVWVLNPSEGFKPLTGEMNKSCYNVLLEKHGRCYLCDCYFIMYCSPVVGEISTWSVAEFVSLLTYKELKSLLFLLWFYFNSERGYLKNIADSLHNRREYRCKIHRHGHSDRQENSPKACFHVCALL